MDRQQLLTYQRIAEHVCIEAGKILLSYFQRARIVNRKSDFGDIATEADLASEKYILKSLATYFPYHSFLAEESGKSISDSEFTWVIDPLDGTKEYARGITLYNVSIALEYKKKLIVGVVYRPATHELFSAREEGGVTLNQKRMRVSSQSDLHACFLSVVFPFYKTSEKETRIAWSLYKHLAATVYRVRPFMEAAANLSWVAMGAHDGFILCIEGPKWWDVAPGILMVEEGGGRVTDIYGGKIKNRDLSRGLVASNGTIHEELLSVIKRASHEKK